MPTKHYKNGQGVKPPAQSVMEVNHKRPLLSCGSHDKEAIMVQLPDCSTVVICEKCKAEIKSSDEKEDASRYELFPEASESEPEDDNTTVNNPDGQEMPTV